MNRRTFSRSRIALAAAVVAVSAVAGVPTNPVSGAQVGPTDDFQVSETSPTPSQSHVAYNADDEQYLVVWASQDGALESRVWGRIIDARTGAGITSEFLISELNGGDPGTGHVEPDVVWNSVANEYVVVSAGDDTTDAPLIITTFEIYAQRVSAAGALVGSSVRVSDMGSDDTNGSFDANQPAIAHDPGNNQYLVVWDGDDDTAPLANGHDEIFGQLLAADLTVPVGAANDVRLSDMGVDGDGTADARGPAIAWEGSQYLVVWEGDDDSVTWEIHGQYVNSDATESGVDFLISTDVANDEAYDADVAANTATGDAMVVWEHDDGAGNDFEIEGAIVNGTPGTSFAVSEVGTAAFTVETPAVAYHPTAGAFSVVWAGDHSTLTIDNEFEVFHVLLDSAGVELEAIERISTMGTDGVASTSVTHPDIAAGPDTASGVVWAAVDAPATDSEVWGQFVAPDTDLEIVSKTLTSSANPGPGDPVVYEIVYTNNGPGDVFDVRITDPIPADVTINSVGSTGATLIPDAGENLAWDIASLPSGSGGTITLTGVVAATATNGSVVSNTATISVGALGADSVPANNAKTADFTVDAAPSVTIDQGAAQADPTDAGPVVFDVVFSEDVTGFDSPADVTIGGTAPGMLSAVIGAVDAATYTVTVSGMTGDGTVTVSIPAGAANDTGPATKASLASTSTDNSVTLDTTAPTVTVEQATGQADSTNASPINFTATFSEDVSGFVDGDVTLGGTAGATTATVTGGPSVYNIAMSGMTDDGTVTASIGAATATDLAGNGNEASTSTDNLVTYDATAPTVTVEQAAGQSDPANGTSVLFDVVFSEDVTGFGEADLTVGGFSGATSAGAVIAGAGATYTVEVTTIPGDGVVTLAVVVGAASDLAGNTSEASTSVDNSVLVDRTVPTVTVEQGAGQTDSTNTTPIVFDVVFSENVTGFDGADVTIGGTAGATTATVTPIDAANYTVEISGMTGNGTVIATVGAATVTDAASNANAASTSTDNVVTYIAGDVTPGVNDGPVVSAPAAAAAELAQAALFTGADAVSVTDPDALGADIVVTLDADDDETVISVVAATGVVVVGNGSDSVTLTGAQSDINATLASLSITANNVGDVTVTVAADDQGNTDGAALTDNADIVITVTDTVAPTINAPSAVTASTDPGKAGAIVTFDVTVDDPGSDSPARLVETQPAPTLDCDPNSGSFYPIGDTTVTCTATDASGNSSVESFVVTVTDDEDPTIAGAVDQTVTLPVGTRGAVRYRVPTATDNSGAATIVCAPASGSTLSVGTTTVSCTATDAAGNSAQASFGLTVLATRIPDTGGSLTFLPWAAALLGVGLVLFGSVRINRRHAR